ncbi:MAG TPA: carboxypeptidase regulatory-like domain-containing protein [Bryobacteraceae bacterium]|nr:carboxypeptidase regulatory-like domain-containing protein [Bryobacteraceae bacterium]
MKSGVTAALGLVLAAAGLYGQAISTSQINGVVRDASGLAVPGAEVKATQTETGQVRTTLSQADGSYVLANLPVGPYQLEISKEGFTRYVQSGIVLQVGSTPTVDVAMKVGAVTEQVQVEANAALVETRSAGVGSVMDNQRVLELPLNGRQVTELIFLSGMATMVNGAGLNSGVRNFPTVDISVAGGLSNGLTYRLDGATHNDPYNNLNLPLPFPDAMQEFKVETSALPAQYGHHSAAAVNAVTKSGTNEFHGDLFEFIRNGAVNARYTFASTVDSLKRNQFGGTLGGPIVKNKLFFFIGEQSTVLRTAPSTNVAFVPTAQMLAGDFTAITAPQCNTRGQQINLSAPFQNNRISPALFSAPALKILQFPGFPTSDNPCGQIQFGRSTRSNQYDSLARTDYQKSEKQSIYFRYLNAHLDQPSDFDPKNLLAASTAALNFQTQSGVLGDTYLIGPDMVSTFHATFNRSAVPKTNPTVFGPNDVGINMWPGVPGLMRITVTNGFALASNNETPSTYNTMDFEFAEDMSLVRGPHQIGFGADFIRSYLNGTSGLNASGPFTFNGQVSSGSAGLGLADFMIGKPSAFTQATTTLAYDRMNYFGLYLQDTWKLTPRLTINYGLRWDPYLPVSSKYGWTPHFDPALFPQNTHSTVFVNAPSGLLFPGDSGYPGNGVAKHRWDNLAPRVSLAWDVKGDGKTSVRAAYGRFFDLPAMNNYVGFGSTPPIGNTTTVNFPTSFADPWAGIPGGNPYPLGVSRNSPFINYGTYENFLLNPKTTYSQQWNLSIQRQLGQNWLIAANYVGTSIIHLWGGNQIDPGILLPGATAANVNSRRFFYLQNPAQGIFYGSINQLDDGGTGNYNGLVLSAQHRIARGFSIQGNYTWSHCISDLANPELAVAGSNFTIPNNRHYDRSNCILADRRQLFNLSAVFEMPKFSDKALRTIASGWQFSPIFKAETGPYMTVTSGLDQALTGQGNQRAVQVLGNPYTPNRSATSYLNPAAFTQPAPGTYSPMGANNVLAPGAFYFNAAVTRTFQIHERKSLQFRFEGFNIPNRANLGPPNGLSGNGTATSASGFITPTAAINNPLFGKILSSDDPRILQGALKFVF